MDRPAPASRTAGTQTLARGLRVLEAVAASADGLTVRDISELTGIHRTAAYRLLNTLADAGFVAAGPDGRHRGTVGLLRLTNGAYTALRSAAVPVLEETAAQLRAPVALIVRDGDEAAALAVVSPPRAGTQLTFTDGSRHPLHRGAAGLATLASGPRVAGEPDAVARVREAGVAQTFGEVEPGMHGLAVPLDASRTGVQGCLNVISATERSDTIEPLRSAADRIAAAFCPAEHRLA